MEEKNIMEEVVEKVEDAKEVVETFSESADIVCDADPTRSKTEVIAAGILALLGLLGVFKLIDIFKGLVKKFKKWRARKRAEKHPEDYVTAGADEVEEEKPAEASTETSKDDTSKEETSKKKK